MALLCFLHYVISLNSGYTKTGIPSPMSIAMFQLVFHFHSRIELDVVAKRNAEQSVSVSSFHIGVVWFYHQLYL